MNILDIFCGAGGLSSGFTKAGFKISLGVDISSAAIETFKKNHHGAEGWVADLTKKDTKTSIIEFAQKHNIRGIIGGPPCQGFSLKGKKLGLQDERNFLFKEYLYLVEQIQPDFIVMENVKALVNTANGFFLDEIKRNLEKLGLKIAVKVLNAKDYGVPQSRERVFIIGMRKNQFDFENVKKSTLNNVDDAISDLFFLESGEGEFFQNYCLPTKSEYQAEMRLNSNGLFNHQATRHSQIALDKLKLIPSEGDKSSLPIELHGKQKFGTTWSRLKWKEPSPTIDTRFDTPSNGCNSHPVLHRAITPREAARLQSFPDNFIFYGKKTDICRLIGNAVPPKLAFALATAIKTQLI